MEFPYECAEQTWNRYYANSLGMLIAKLTPKIKSIFEQWKAADTASLLSALQQREDLKSSPAGRNALGARSEVGSRTKEKTGTVV